MDLNRITAWWLLAELCTAVFALCVFLVGWSFTFFRGIYKGGGDFEITTSFFPANITATVAMWGMAHLRPIAIVGGIALLLVIVIWLLPERVLFGSYS